MICEICGKREAKIVVEIEGAEMNCCFFCGKNAKIIGKIGDLNKKEEKTLERFKENTAMEEERIIDGYGEQIKRARIKKGLSREELAKLINEKESYLKHIEREEMIPNDKVVKKLERALSLKLKEKISSDIIEVKTEKKKDETLEDIADIEGEF